MQLQVFVSMYVTSIRIIISHAVWEIKLNAALGYKMQNTLVISKKGNLFPRSSC